MIMRVVALWSLAAVLATPQGAHGRGLSFVPRDHWVYEALDRLATLGLVPLDALASRPITRLEARKLVEQALLKANVAGPAGVRLVREDLLRLAEEFSADSPVTVTVGGLAVTGQRSRLAPDRSIGASSVAWEFALRPALSIAGRVVGGGEVATTPRSEMYASFALGSVTGQVGRAPLWWGPSLRSSLLLSDNAGTLPLVRLAAGIPRVRLTKVVALLERPAGPQRADALLVGTRLDWLVTPHFRLGLSESVVTTWGHPLIAFHLVHPLPIFFSAVAANYLHDALGAPHNALASVDFDWLIRPGVRMYGALLVDDAGERLSPRLWRLGLLAGLHLLDPFRTGRTSLRLEYSLVTNGTYSYCCGLEYAFLGRSLGHWLGPDGDDLYVEVTHRLSPATILQLSYAYTRRGQGFVGQPAPGPQDWFLSGIVERRHTLGVQVHQIHSLSLETRYRAEVASVANRGNLAGAQATEGRLSVDVTYRWPAVAASSTGRTATASVPAPPGTPAVPPDAAGRISLRHWAATGASQGPLSATPGGTLFGASYRIDVRGLPLIMGYDADARGDQVFWSAALYYPLVRVPHGTVSVFAGWGGLRLRGTLGGTPQDLTSSGPRLGMHLFYRPALNGVAAPLYLTGNISTNIRGSVSSTYLWTYALGAGWSKGSVTLEAGYRGAAAMWRAATPEMTTMRWDGLYFGVSIK